MNLAHLDGCDCYEGHLCCRECGAERRKLNSMPKKKPVVVEARELVKIQVVRVGSPRHKVLLQDIAHGETFRFFQQREDSNVYMRIYKDYVDNRLGYIGLSTGSIHSSDGNKPVVRVACTLTYKDIE